MDVGGSFLDLSCVRIAVIPAGASMTECRFEELTSHLTSFREIPVSALPRRTPMSRNAASSSFASHASYAAVPSTLRHSFSETSSPGPLLRSRSASKDIGSSSRPSLGGAKNQTRLQLEARSMSSLGPSIPNVSQDLEVLSKAIQPVPRSPTHTADLDLAGPEVGSSFRMRYDVIHRDRSGDLIMKPFSEWDDFHSSKIWGVFGLVDCTGPDVCESAEKRKLAIFDAYDDFSAVLTSFGDASVRRLIVFTSQDAAHESGAFILNDARSPSQDKNDSMLHFSVGYVPEQSKNEETRLEVRAQLIHFAGLLLNVIDRECWKRRESPTTELVLSPIDEKYTADRQSKLIKRRPGRLDKLLGDGHLLMGNPSEAIVKYNSAIEKAKTNSDRLWLAGAMEGWSAAYVLSHVGAGGAVNDRELSDRLIEHYAEVYKLYQKKRVAEPEAAAALRLAEFLGRWTDRRKEALDAAEHAATVGEGLRLQKRAALWEALARFCDRMGCRRKAALFLFRLGHLNAVQSAWSSAVALMVASERQLTRNGMKPWAYLNRKVLLAAASSAEEAGDPSSTSRLYMEAITLPRNPASWWRENDAELARLLSKSQVPAYLPAARNVVSLHGISVHQSPNLSIRNRANSGAELGISRRSAEGPFIYNPFEAKKRAEKAAVAQRCVTWVRGEPAQVSVTMSSSVTADISLEIIAVLFSGPDELLGEHNSAGGTSKEATSKGHVTGCSNNEEVEAHLHSEYVRNSLSFSNRIAQTMAETVNLGPTVGPPGLRKNLTVLPKRAGELVVRGILVRLFRGALVVLKPPPSGSDTPVNVVPCLPRVSITHIIDGGSMERISGVTPLTVFSGERHQLRIEVMNSGKEPISWMKGVVRSSSPELAKVMEHSFDETMAESLGSAGTTKSCVISLLCQYPHESYTPQRGQFSKSWGAHNCSPIVSILLEYEGKRSPGIIRESGLHVKLALKPAISIERVDMLGAYSSFPKTRVGGNPAICRVALEIKNHMAAPAIVKLCQVAEHLHSEHDVAEESELPDSASSRKMDRCLVESRASTRLISCLALPQINSSRNAPNPRMAVEDGSKEAKVAVFRVFWTLPALGREGHWDISARDLQSAMRGYSKGDLRSVNDDPRRDSAGNVFEDDFVKDGVS